MVSHPGRAGHYPLPGLLNALFFHSLGIEETFQQDIFKIQIRYPSHKHSRRRHRLCLLAGSAHRIRVRKSRGHLVSPSWHWTGACDELWLYPLSEAHLAEHLQSSMWLLRNPVSFPPHNTIRSPHLQVPEIKRGMGCGHRSQPLNACKRYGLSDCHRMTLESYDHLSQLSTPNNQGLSIFLKEPNLPSYFF